MPRNRTGPLRTGSVRASRRITGAVAVLGIVAAIVSDEFAGGFWNHHSLLSGIVASVIVVALSVAVINQALERRTRRRWRVLAQHVMLELARDARLTWMGIMELTSLMPPAELPSAWIEAAAGIVRDTPRLSQAMSGLVADGSRRRRLQDEIAFLVSHNEEVIGRWAAVMLNADAYAELIDRHVELERHLTWLGSVLDNFEPPDDVRRRRRARSSPAVQMEPGVGDELLTQRLVVITQLAEELDRGTLDIAIRIVPFEWWGARLGPTPPAGPRTVGKPNR